MNNPVILISGQYSAFSEGWNGAGVYMASGIYVSETFKQPIYVGSSINLRKRINEHLRELNDNEHHNGPFQYAWINHNQNFVWFLLETCPPEKTFEREQYYLDTIRPFVDEFSGFNIGHDAKTGMKGRKHSEEARRKISEGNKGRVKSEEERQKLSEAKKGIPKSRDAVEKSRLAHIGLKHSEEAKQRMSESHRSRSPISEETRRKMSEAAHRREAKRRLK